MNKSQLHPAVQAERLRCLKCVEHCANVPIHDPVMLMVLHKISAMIRLGMQVSEAEEIESRGPDALDDTDPVYF